MKNGSVAVVVPASIVVLVDDGPANAVTETYLKVQSAASRVFLATSETFNAANDVAEQVVHTVKSAVDFVTPYVQQSADCVYKVVFPVAVELQKQAERAIQSSGYDTKPTLEVAKTAASTAGEGQKYIEGAKPSISSTLQNVLSSGAGALCLLYFLAPLLLSSLSTAAGFKGELTAPQALIFCQRTTTGSF